MILVVGATGYLGGLICKELTKAGRPVRAMARQSANTAYLKSLGVEVVTADLDDPASLPKALTDCDTVIYTANGAAPTRRGDGLGGDVRRLKAMADAAQRAGAKRFLFVSGLMPTRSRPLLLYTKWQAEEYLRNTDLDYTIIRAGLFMEVWLGMMGSSMPTAPVEPGLTHTLERPGYGRKYYNAIRHSIDRDGVALVAGKGTSKIAFVATADVARIIVMSLDEPQARRNTLELPGVTLTPLETVKVFERVLNRQLAVKFTPVFMLWLMRWMVGLFVSRAGGYLIEASITGAVEDVTPDGYHFRRLFPTYTFQTPEQFLKERLALTEQILKHAG